MDIGFGILIGVVMGALLAILGGGGSLFIVPILLVGFQTPVSHATGTSLVVVFAGAVVSAIGHWRGGRLNVRALTSFAPASFLGASIGALLHGLAPEKTVLIALALVQLVASARMIFGKIPEREESEVVSLARTIPLGFVLGVMTGFVGTGGGFLIVPMLVWGAHLAFRDAVGTSVALIAVSSASGAVTHVLERNVDVELALSIGGGAMLGAVLGIPLSGRIPERPLQLAFGVLIFVAALYLLFRVFG